MLMLMLLMLMLLMTQGSELYGLDVFSDNTFVLWLVVAVHSPGSFLGRVGDVWLVEEGLYPEEDLLDGDGGGPALGLCQDGQADLARGIHVGVVDGRREPRHRRLGRVVFRKRKRQPKHSPLPDAPLLPRNPTRPHKQVQAPVALLARLCKEPLSVSSSRKGTK